MIISSRAGDRKLSLGEIIMRTPRVEGPSRLLDRMSPLALVRLIGLASKLSLMKSHTIILFDETPSLSEISCDGIPNGNFHAIHRVPDFGSLNSK